MESNENEKENGYIMEEGNMMNGDDKSPTRREAFNIQSALNLKKYEVCFIYI